MPTGPWRDLAIDLLGPLTTGESILVVVDYYSCYYEIHIMRSTVASKVISSLEEIFARHGVKAKLLELWVFFVFFVRVYLQLVVIVYSFLLLYCLLSFWCHHRCVMLRNLSSFLV